MSVRLPSAAAYAPQVEKEQKWLPIFPISRELDKLFDDVIEKLDDLIEILNVDLEQKQTELEQFHSHPELIDDPINLFRLALRRHELLVKQS